MGLPSTRLSKAYITSGFLFILSIIITWIAYTSNDWVAADEHQGGTEIRDRMGLNKECISTHSSKGTDPLVSCSPITCGRSPGQNEFCVTWKSSAFAVTLSMLCQFAMLGLFIALFTGPADKRRVGYHLLVIGCLIICALQVIPMILIPFILGRDERFPPQDHWGLGMPFALNAVSAVTNLLIAIGVGLVGRFWPPTDYEALF